MGAGRGVRDDRASDRRLAPDLGVVVGILWSRLRRPEASSSSSRVAGRKRRATRGRSASRGGVSGDPTLGIAYRLADGQYVDASAVRAPSSCQATPGQRRHPIGGRQEVAVLVHDPALLDEPALVVRSVRHCRARPRNRATGRRGAFTAGRGSGVTRAHRGCRRRRTSPDRHATCTMAHSSGW